MIFVERPFPNPTTGAASLHHTRTRRPGAKATVGSLSST